MNGAYLWLFQHIPFFDAFRDPSKWLFMVSFAYSCLLGYAANSINHIKKTSLATAKKIWTKKNFKRILSTSLVVVTLTTYALPYLNNDYAKALRATTYPESYYEVDKWLAEQENNFKVTWLPTDTGIKYTWAPYPCRDPFAFFGSKSTFELGNKQFSRWLTMNMYLNSTEYLGKLLGIAHVKYLIIPDDRQSNTLMFYVKAFPFYKERLLQTLHAQKGLNPILQIDDTEIRENTFFQENIRTTNNYLVDMNSDLTDLIYLTYIGDETSNIFTKTAVLFLSQIQENISD
ncbi:MAG: hypothetical protein QXH37_08925, partial [Candidatus Bathyarchaeia archaeon]